MYVIGSSDNTMNVNYKVDLDNHRIHQKHSLHAQ